MLDSTRQKGEIIKHLETALGLAQDIREDIVAFLIERCLDETRANQWVAIDRTKPWEE
jgi:hypothetical protein